MDTPGRDITRRNAVSMNRSRGLFLLGGQPLVTVRRKTPLDRGKSLRSAAHRPPGSGTSGLISDLVGCFSASRLDLTTFLSKIIQLTANSACVIHMLANTLPNN